MSAASTTLLQAHNVTKVFTGGIITRTETVALRNFTFTIDTARPSITGVVGESGSGKSTMARLLLGLETPTTGRVEYRGKDLRSLNNAERRAFRQEVQAVFQDPFESSTRSTASTTCSRFRSRNLNWPARARKRGG
jgi:ABC-type oligopeptide transport system ATPase subunit